MKDTENNIKIGHLKKADASKIDTVPVTEGQVIYSEEHAVQFVDYDNKRHIYGDIISGVFTDKYVDFNSDITWEDTLSAIKTSGVKDGQKVRIANNMMVFRKINNYNFLTIEKINPGTVPFIINYGGTYNISHQTTVLFMDIILKQLYILTIDVASNGTIQVHCEDLNGVISDMSTIATVTLTGSFLQIVPYGTHVFDVISFSDSKIPSLSGFYSIIDDLA